MKGHEGYIPGGKAIAGEEPVGARRRQWTAANWLQLPFGCVYSSWRGGTLPDRQNMGGSQPGGRGSAGLVLTAR